MISHHEETRMRTNNDQPCLWFIQRFCPTETTRQFARRNNGLEAVSKDQRKKMPKMRQTHARYHFSFQETVLRILVIPAVPEAEWSRGSIWYDADNEIYRFTSSKTIDLFTSLD